MGSVHSSAGVYVTEIDQSQYVAPASTSVGAIVGESYKGPVGVPTLVTSNQDFIKIFGKPTPTLTYMHYCALAFLEVGNQLYVTRVAPQSKYGGAVVSTANNLNSVAPLNAGFLTPDDYQFLDDQLFLIYGANQGTWTNDVRVDIYPNTKIPVPDTTFFIDVYLRGQSIPVEHHLVSLKYMIDGYGVQINIEEYINTRSTYIQVVQNRQASAFTSNPNRTIINTLCSTYLEGGDNGVKATSGQIITAWQAYNDPEVVSVNILINGGYSAPEVQLAMDTICQSRKDCMAILDMPSDEQSLANAVNYRRNNLMMDSSYSAIYSPDYLILDEHNDLRIYVPPSGHVAAAYARTDLEHATWFAPAGVDNGRLSVLGVKVEYDQGDRDVFADHQINPTRVIPGSGIRIWGADTLQVMASALTNVSVRRLMLFLEKSLSRAVLYSVFDPNDQILRLKLTELCERFLTPIRQARGLYGFGVTCDDSNNTPATIANGDCILDVYVDPVLPAKRIYLVATITRTGAVITASTAP